MKKNFLVTQLLVMSVISYSVTISTANIFTQDEFETYENEEFGFAIEYSSDWKPETLSSFEIEMVGYVPYIIKFELPGSLNDDVNVRKWRPAVTIGVDSLQGSTSLEDYVSERIDNLAFSDSNINSNETILGGNPAYKVDSVNPAGEIKKLFIYTMNNEGRIYDIDYSAHEASFDAYLPIVQKMIESFRLTGSNPVNGTFNSTSQNNVTQGQETEEAIPGLSFQNDSAFEQEQQSRLPTEIAPVREEEAKIEPLKIVLQLEKNTEFGDSPIRFDITGYSFEMEGLQQGETKNYELVMDGLVTGQTIVHPTNIVLSYIGTLEVENKIGDMTETDIRDVGGIVYVDKILENTEKTIYIFGTPEQGFVEVGDQKWYNVTRNITMTSDNNGIMTIESGANQER